MSYESKAAELGVDLSKTVPPVANYVRAVRTGNLVFLSGQGPYRPDGSIVTGKVGAELSLEEGYAAARLTMIKLLASLREEAGIARQCVAGRQASLHGELPARLRAAAAGGERGVGLTGGAVWRGGAPRAVGGRDGLAADGDPRRDRDDRGAARVGDGARESGAGDGIRTCGLVLGRPPARPAASPAGSPDRTPGPPQASSAARSSSLSRLACPTRRPRYSRRQL